MNKRYIRIGILILVICLFIITPLTGCSMVSKITGTPSGDKNTVVTSVKNTTKSASSKPIDSPAAKFSAAFKKLDKNPLNEDIQYALWLTATSKDIPKEGGGQSQTANLVGLADKYKKLVDSQGVHYTEVNEAFGMNLESEYWLKNGKFKIVDSSLNEVTVFDGEYYVKYNTDEKSGARYKKSSSLISADISIKSYGVLPNLAKAPYIEKEGQKFEAFNCSVFFMDMEVMGMKGNTLWVDKDTGMLVKNAVGDEKQGMVTHISKFEAGGFKDDVFTVPSDIKLKDE